MQVSLQPYFDLCFTAIDATFEWFTSIFDGQWLLLVISFPVFFMAVRLIVFPLFGSDSSDSVRDKDDNSHER